MNDEIRRVAEELFGEADADVDVDGADLHVSTGETDEGRLRVVVTAGVSPRGATGLCEVSRLVQLDDVDGACFVVRTRYQCPDCGYVDLGGDPGWVQGSCPNCGF